MIMHLRCYIYGQGEQWQAICTDIDLAVDANSMQEAMDLLKISIQTYFDDVNALSPEERHNFRYRRSPLSVRVGLALSFIVSTIFGSNSNGGPSAHIEMRVPCPA